MEKAFNKKVSWTMRWMSKSLSVRGCEPPPHPSICASLPSLSVSLAEMNGLARSSRLNPNSFCSAAETRTPRRLFVVTPRAALLTFPWHTTDVAPCAPRCRRSVRRPAAATAEEAAVNERERACIMFIYVRGRVTRAGVVPLRGCSFFSWHFAKRRYFIFSS